MQQLTFEWASATKDGESVKIIYGDIEIGSGSSDPGSSVFIYQFNESSTGLCLEQIEEYLYSEEDKARIQSYIQISFNELVEGARKVLALVSQEGAA